MPYRLEILPRAARELEDLPSKVRARVEAAILRLSEIPRPSGTVKLQASRDLFRVRVGEYRVV